MIAEIYIYTSNFILYKLFKNPDMLSTDTKMIFNSRNIIFEHFAMFCVNDYGINQSKSKS